MVLLCSSMSCSQLIDFSYATCIKSGPTRVSYQTGSSLIGPVMLLVGGADSVKESSVSIVCNLRWAWFGVIWSTSNSTNNVVYEGVRSISAVLKTHLHFCARDMIGAMLVSLISAKSRISHAFKPALSILGN